MCLLSGDARISCYGPETRGSANTTLAAGGTAQVNVVVQSRSTVYARSYAGLEFETRLSDVVVAKVEAGGPGDKAGIKPGDALQKIGDRGVDGDWGADNVLRMLEVRPPGTELKLTIERDDKEQTVTLKLDPPHASSE